MNVRSDAFQQRVLFNVSKLYVSQAKKGGKYSELQPVYSLNLVNDIFAHDTPDFIHNYRIVHDKDSNGMRRELREFYEGEMQAFDDLIAVLIVHDAVVNFKTDGYEVLRS